MITLQLLLQMITASIQNSVILVLNQEHNLKEVVKNKIKLRIIM